jgi:hypothetical protein
MVTLIRHHFGRERNMEDFARKLKEIGATEIYFDRNSNFVENEIVKEATLSWTALVEKGGVYHHFKMMLDHETKAAADRTMESSTNILSGFRILHGSIHIETSEHARIKRL